MSTYEPSDPSWVPPSLRQVASIRIAIDSQRPAYQRGDMLFGNRLSTLQAVMNVSGDLITHSAIVGLVDGQLRAIEMGPKGCTSRLIEDFCSAYRFVGLGRLAMDDCCVDRVASAAENHFANKSLAYSWRSCALLEVVSLLRRGLPARAEELVVAGGLRLAQSSAARHGQHKVTCSGFVSMCVDAACTACRPPLVWPSRRRPVPFRGAPSVTDVRPAEREPLDDSLQDAVRVLTMPSDLWVSTPFAFKAVLQDGRQTLLFDLTSKQSHQSTSRPDCLAKFQKGGAQ
jgi:hypothetical protein